MKRITFALALVIIFSLLLGQAAFGISLGNSLTPPPANPISPGYSFGYWSNGSMDYGYNTYRDQPLRDLNQMEGAANGQLIKMADNDSVFLIQEGNVRMILSAGAFLSWGFRWEDIKTVDEAFFSKFMPGGVLFFRPGTLVRTFREPAIYVFGLDNAFHWIPDMATFNALGFDTGSIMEIPLPEFELYMTGYDIQSAAIPLAWTPVKGSGSTVYLWGEGPIVGGAATAAPFEPQYLWEIMSPAAFESWNLDWNGILEMSDAELGQWLSSESTIVNPMWAKPGTLVVSAADPAVYAADYLQVQTKVPQESLAFKYGFVKRCIVSPTVFDAMGFHWNEILSEDAGVLASIPRGTDVMGGEVHTQ